MLKRVAIIGGGPIGIEAALAFAERDFEVTVFERGATGAHVARWGHVKFFSPWRLNRSERGTRLLAEAGHELPDDESFPTGSEYLQTYLRPLTELDPIAGRVRNLTTVRAVTRRNAWKGDYVGDPARADSPFLLSVSGPDGDEWVEADVVLDASGVYDQPGRLGPGGVPALGEDRARDRIERWIPDVVDRDRELYENRRVMVVGEGHSATTTLRLLTRLREEASDTEVLWVLRSDGEPYVELPDDPLPERLVLSQFGNLAARGEVAGIEPIGPAQILALDDDGDGVGVVVATPAGERREVVDRIVANVGYRPNTEMTRELQVHHCWASEGPMKLAATLLAQSPNADCLTQESGGIDTLRNPEPNFFVIGGKSYGRNSNFLLRVGFEQIEEIVEALT